MSRALPIARASAAPVGPVVETEVLRVARGPDGVTAEHAVDAIAAEEPLEIRVRFAREAAPSRAGAAGAAGTASSLAVTMRTPGHDAELAVGFLLSEGVLREAGDLLEVTEASGAPRDPGAHVTVTLHERTRARVAPAARHFYTTSSCGVCGKASIEALRAAMPTAPLAPGGGLGTSPDVLLALPDALRASQRSFERTGGLHAAALFDAAGALSHVREDVGRHNAVDKLVGARFLEARATAEEPSGPRGLLVSGRASFELVQKALMAGLPMLAAVGAPSSLAVATARAFGLTLVGFLREGRFNVYAGAGAEGVARAAPGGHAPEERSAPAPEREAMKKATSKRAAARAPKRGGA